MDHEYTHFMGTATKTGINYMPLFTIDFVKLVLILETKFMCITLLLNPKYYFNSNQQNCVSHLLTQADVR